MINSEEIVITYVGSEDFDIYLLYTENIIYRVKPKTISAQMNLWDIHYDFNRRASLGSDISYD
jgi:hypothetical protein